jgi:peptidoglycan/LPS O-acetylase OafA/YrhL
MHDRPLSGLRYPGLDVFRISAMLCVFYSHSVAGVVKGILIGNVGVEMFFVLSGFLVGRHFFSGSEPYSWAFARTFILKRWLRTLPLYYTVLILKLLLSSYTVSDVWRYVFFIQNYMPSIAFFHVSWSLSIEEWFYLLLPLLALLVIRSPFNTRRLLIIIAFIFIVSVLLRYHALLYQQAPWEWITTCIHLRMDSLLTGFLLVLIKFKFPVMYRHLSHRAVLMSGILLAAGYLYLFGMNYLSQDLNHLFFFRVLGFPVLSISFALMIPSLESITLRKGMHILIITWGSLLTYSFYLVHTDVIGSLKKADLRGIYLVASSFVVSAIISFALYYLVEKPFLRLKEKIRMPPA